jgi:hypothetical protein
LTGENGAKNWPRIVVGRTNGALASDTRVKDRYLKKSEPRQDVAPVVGYGRHNVGMANDILTAREASSKVV